MNRKKILLTATTILLATVGVFASIKKSSPSALYIKTAGGTCKTQPLTSSVPSSWASSGTNQVSINTGTHGTQHLTIWSTTGCTSAAYLNN